jgi:DNA-binding NarL/FixJ family response regulator
MAPKKTLIIVDDHSLFREGLKAILERNPGYEVIAEAGSGREAIRLIRQLKPDLALVDMSLPDQNGIELTAEILRISPGTRIMIVSMHHKIDYIVKAFQAGAAGYVVKESASAKLLQGVETVLKGDYYLDASVSQQVVKKLAGLHKKDLEVSDEVYNALTLREQEVMLLVAEGLSTRAISERLFISPKTVENHRSNIMNKLGLHSSIELARYAARIGLIDIDLWKE